MTYMIYTYTNKMTIITCNCLQQLTTTTINERHMNMTNIQRTCIYVTVRNASKTKHTV